MKGMRVTWYEQQQIAQNADDACYEALDFIEQNHRSFWSVNLYSIEDQVWIAIALNIRDRIREE